MHDALPKVPVRAILRRAKTSTVVGGLIFVVVQLIGLSAWATPEPSLQLDRLDHSWWLGEAAEIWVDQDQNTKHVRDIPADASWRKVDGPRETLQLAPGVLWLRVRVQDTRAVSNAETAHWRVEFSHPRPVRLTAYVPRDGTITEVRSGLVTPLPEREVKSRAVVVPFDLSPGESATLHFRLETAPLGFSAILTSRQESARRNADSQWLLGLYYGIALALFLYNLFILVTLRDITYGWYLLFIGFTVLFFAGRNGYVWAAGWTPGADAGGGVIVAAQLVAIAYFARNLLKTRLTLPRFDRLLQAITMVTMAAGGSALFWPRVIDEAFVAPLAGVILVAVLIAGVLRLRQNSVVARYFLLAWGLFLAGALLYVFKAAGVIPHTYVTEHAMQVGSALEMILLSLALADRVRTLEITAEERKRQLVSLREESARRLLDAQDEYNRRVAADLHDALGHRFLLIERIAAELPREADHERGLAIRALAREGITETHELAHGLYPRRLQHLGLEGALQAAADSIARSDLKVRIRLQAGLADRMATSVQLAALRVAEEALQNAMRHAQASELTMDFHESSDQRAAVIIVSDDGIGLEPADSLGHGLGLRTMADRAAQVDGELKLGTSEQGGTRVWLRLPLSPPAS